MKPYLIGCGLDVLGGNVIAEIMILFLNIVENFTQIQK